MTCSKSALHNPPSHSGGTLVSVADLPPATIVVRGDTHIACQASAAGDCTINFANRPAVFAIERGANLTFRQITMNNFHSSVSDEAKQLVIKPSALSVWPTILVENGSTVGFINSSLTNVSPFCGENTYPIILASYRRTFGDSNVVPLQDGRILVMGEHWASYNLVNTTSNASVGTYTIHVAGNTVLQCLPEQGFVYTSQFSPINVNITSAPSPPPVSAPSPSHLAVILPLAIAVPLLLLVALALLVLWVRRRGRSSRRSTADLESTASKKSTTAPTTALETVESTLSAEVSELWPALTTSPSTAPTTPTRTALAERALAHRFQRPADLVLGPLLGTGSHASVYKARWHGTVVAAKVVLHARGDRHSTVDAQHVQCLLAANHPNVVACYRVWTEEVGPLGEGPSAVGPLGNGDTPTTAAAAATHPHVLAGAGGLFDVEEQPLPRGDDQGLLQTTLLLEYCDRGTLRKAVRAGKLWLSNGGNAHRGDAHQTPDLPKILTYAMDIASGLAFLHGQSIVHGDLHSDNVLLQSMRRTRRASTDQSPPHVVRSVACKVSDMGNARYFGWHEGKTHSMATTLGALAYQAPEVLQEGRLSHAADTYSFGCVVWEMLSGRQPFANVSQGQLLMRVAVWGEHEQVPDSCPEALAGLLLACWQREPAARPDMDTVLDRLHAIRREVMEGSCGNGARASSSFETQPYAQP